MDQVRVDHGTEFCLILAVQNHLASLRTRHDHPAYMQTISTNNHRVERLWPEINRRVNYPIKEILVNMEASSLINMQDETIKFCVSWTTIQVASVGLIQFIQAWNSHRIAVVYPRGGSGCSKTPLSSGTTARSVASSVATVYADNR